MRLVNRFRLAPLLRWMLCAAAIAVGGVAAAWGVLGAQRGDALSVRAWRAFVRADTPAAAAAEAAADTTSVAVPPGAPDPAVASTAPASEPDGRPPMRALEPVRAAEQLEQYRAQRNKPIEELQPFRAIESAPLTDGGSVTLTNLHPEVNRWYLLDLPASAGARRTVHLQNLFPERQDLALAVDSAGIAIVTRQSRSSCALWGPGGVLDSLGGEVGYAYVCDGQVALRVHATGQKSRMERVTDFLRDRLPAGERITVFVRQTFYQDAYLKTAEVALGPVVVAAPGEAGPEPARLEPDRVHASIAPVGVGLPLRLQGGPLVEIGSWYPVEGDGGVFFSAVRTDAVAAPVDPAMRQRMAPPDEVEARALAILVAFELGRFDVRFSVGTDHPRVGWSDRVAAGLRPAGLAGPDGIDRLAPLVVTGMVPPHLVPRITATFTGGFKRTHGAFRYGDLAETNLGSHYGFVEAGTVLSKLQPGLATLSIDADGRLDMRTWESDDPEALRGMAFARQNGVPLVQRGPDGEGEPGEYLTRWGPGNWSGSQDGRYRTLRASACLIDSEAGRYLVYGYFSAATPSTMARVLLAYGCDYAMLLDMNALEHTYLAVYRREGDGLTVSHLVEEMRVLDREEGATTLPRFLAFADNRDFFYLLRKPRVEGGG